MHFLYFFLHDKGYFFHLPILSPPRADLLLVFSVCMHQVGVLPRALALIFSDLCLPHIRTNLSHNTGICSQNAGSPVALLLKRWPSDLAVPSSSPA